MRWNASSEDFAPGVSFNLTTHECSMCIPPMGDARRRRTEGGVPRPIVNKVYIEKRTSHADYFRSSTKSKRS